MTSILPSIRRFERTERMEDNFGWFGKILWVLLELIRSSVNLQDEV